MKRVGNAWISKLQLQVLSEQQFSFFNFLARLSFAWILSYVFIFNGVWFILCCFVNLWMPVFSNWYMRISSDYDFLKSCFSRTNKQLVVQPERQTYAAISMGNLFIEIVYYGMSFTPCHLAFLFLACNFAFSFSFPGSQFFVVCDILMSVLLYLYSQVLCYQCVGYAFPFLLWLVLPMLPL